MINKANKKVVKKKLIFIIILVFTITMVINITKIIIKQSMMTRVEKFDFDSIPIYYSFY